MSVQIRRATKGDLSAIKAINEASLPEHYSDGFYNKHMVHFAELFRVATIDEKVVGYVMCQATVVRGIRMGLIVSVAVAVDQRRKGIGEALVRGAHFHMRANNLQMACLQVRPSNVNAIALYQKLGYSISQIQPNYYTDPVEPALLMSCVL